MIKADLHNYFPSISERKVYRVFESLGYSRLLSFELARLCTWPKARDSTRSNTRRSFPYMTGAEGVLPQGAPTSGALANAATWSLDCALSEFAATNGLVYTRYSDDMAFSSSDVFDRPRAAGLISQFRRIVTSSGLYLHEKKTKIVPPGSRMMLLGMLVTSEGVGILPEHRRRIELYIHSVERYGAVEFSAVRGFDSALSFLNHVYGWLAYLSHIDPQWSGERKIEWERALSRHHIEPYILG